MKTDYSNARPPQWAETLLPLLLIHHGHCLSTGFSAAWRTRSMRAGVLTSFSAATMGALFSIVGTGLMLAVWHDPATLDAWRRSGGLDEAFIDVPLKLIALGVAIGALGAVLGDSACSRADERQGGPPSHSR
jgi:hypothetical protein